jgi:hypothetical protein
MDREKNTEFDNPWKDIIEIYFIFFMQFFFPNIHKAIDWQKGYEFLDKELKQVVRDADTGRRHVDKLAKVYLLTGEEKILYIHTEIQAQYDAKFRHRMFVYHYRIFDRYQKPIVSMAILGDDRPGWKPTGYGYKNFDCELSFNFPIKKLLDYKQDWQALEKDDNPFAIVVMAHLKALETRNANEERLFWKMNLFKALYNHGYSKKEIIELFNFIDWMMVLPAALATRFKNQVIQYEEGRKMPYVSSIERMGIETGMKTGMKTGMERGMEKGALKKARENLIDVLRIRFDKIPDVLVETIQNISDVIYLSNLLKQAVIIDSINTFHQKIQDAKT